MNTNNNNNWKQEQPLFGEPAFVDGIAGQKQVPGEPQFVTGNEHLGNLTPLYADQTRPDPYHPLPQHDQSVPLYGDNQKPIYADQVSGTNKLYPGQENFLGKQLKFVDGKEVLTTGGVVQAAYVPPSHGEEHKTDVHSPDNQHITVPVEHLYLKPTDEHVHVIPDAERIHLKVEQDAAVEQVIRIKPDGQVQITTEKIVEHPTEHLKERHDDTHHKKEHDDTHHHKKEHIEKEKIKTKKVSKKKKHSPRKSKHDVAPVTETTTVVKVSEHEPGTAGYDNEKGKHDDTHHSKKEHDDSHHGKKEHVETHHSKKEHDETHHGKKEHVETHHHSKKEHDDTHHHGKAEHVDTHKEVKSRTTTSD